MAWFDHGPAHIWFEDEGQGEPVLFLPGFSDRIDNHRHLLQGLAGSRRIIAADLPGSGQSGPQPRDYGATYLEQDAGAFAALLAALDVPSAHLVGYSDGGEVALLMAAGTPHLARSLLTWGAQGAVRDPDGQMAAFFRTAVDDMSPGASGYRDYLRTTYGEGPARAMVQGFARGLEAIVAQGGDICQARAHLIVCPSLLLLGQDDGMMHWAEVQALAGRMPHAQAILVEGAGHGLHQDRPDWLASTLHDWLDGH